MTNTIRLSPPFSIAVVTDLNERAVPPARRIGVFSAIETSIAISCLSEVDGETTFTLGAASELDPGRAADFSATLKTPSKNVVLLTAENQQLLRASVNDVRTRVRIWINRPKEPDEVVIGLG